LFPEKLKIFKLRTFPNQMSNKFYFWFFLLTTLVFGFFVFAPKLTGFTIFESSENLFPRVYLNLFVISAIFLIIAIVVSNRKVTSALERLVKDRTGRHGKLWSVHEGSAEIYAAEIPKSYGGKAITEGKENYVKIWLESPNVGERVSIPDVKSALDQVYEKVAGTKQVVIVPTASYSLANAIRGSAIDNSNVEVKELSGENMSEGLFRYLTADAMTRKKQGLAHSRNFPRNRRDFHYFIIKSKD